MPAIVTCCCWSLTECSSFIWIVKEDLKKKKKNPVFKFPSSCLAMWHREELDPMKKAFDLPKNYEWNGKACI